MFIVRFADVWPWKHFKLPFILSSWKNGNNWPTLNKHESIWKMLHVVLYMWSKLEIFKHWLLTVIGPLHLRKLVNAKNIYLQFCHNNKKAQRYLLHGLECVVAMHQAQLISKIPHILKEMYDADLLEEEVIISWSEKVGNILMSSKRLEGLGLFWKKFSNA